jgi:hypothetical protein
MRRYLIVAHRTLGGPHLLEEVTRRRDEAGGRCAFHILVPMEHHGATWTEGGSHAAAEAVVAEGIARFAEHHIDATGEAGDPDPVYAVETLLRTGQEYDEILLSTLPAGPSRWLKLDVPARLRKAVSIPVLHVVAEREPAR